LPYTQGEWPSPEHLPFELPLGPYVVLHVGASTSLKTWDAQRWRQLAAKLRLEGFKVIWSGAASEAAILHAIAPVAEEKTLFGRLDLAQLWHLLSRAQALVCPDTGIAHLARIVGVPTVAIFGPGSASIHGPGAFWANVPFQPVTIAHFPCRDQQVLYRRHIDWVRRCGRSLGADSHQCQGALCMAAVSEDQVWTALKRFL
jgi:ADP-heptose:LPS heptosyltransferase